MRVFSTVDEVRQVAYTPDGARLVICLGNDRGLHLIEWWDMETGRMNGFLGLPGWPTAIAFAIGRTPEIVAYPDGNEIHCLSENNHDHTTEVPVGRLVTAIAMTPDGKQLAYGSPEHPMERSIIAVAPMNQVEQPFEFRTGTRVRSLMFDPLGNYLVSVGVGQYTVWDLNRRESRTAGTLNDVRPISFSRNGELLAVAGNAGTTIFSADGSRTVRAFERPGNSPVGALTFSPDCRTLFLATGAAIHLFDVETGSLRRSYDWGVGMIRSLAVAPDGLTAAAGANGRVVVWDLDS